MPSPRPTRFDLGIRWRKALRDLWLNKSRTILVVLAMSVGVFGVGLVANAYAILTREMDKNYMLTNPASATLLTDALDARFVQSVRDLPSIGDAEARRKVVGRIQVGPDEWRDIWLFIISDFGDIRLDTFKPEQGQWPPAKGEILLERVALSVAKAKLGEVVTVKIPDGPKRELRLVGTVHAPGLAPAWMEGFAYGFITRETLESLGGAPDLNELKITVADTQRSLDKAYIRSVAYQLKDWIEQKGRTVYRVEIPEPGKHPHASQMATLLFLLEAFGLLALVLSGVLVATMISALLAQQVRQIGVMKAVGANASQVGSLYLGIVLGLGVVALAIGMPVAVLAGRAYAAFAVEMLNFEILSNEIPLGIFVLQVAVGLLVPVVAAATPIYRGSRVTVRQAINDYGLGQGIFKPGAFDRLLGRIRGSYRPLMLSLRNTFRRRWRLALTLGTLAMGGAGFIVAMNVSASMNSTVAVKFNATHYDIQLRFDRPYRVERIEQTIGGLPGVARVEGWGGAKAARVYQDGTQGNSFNVIAPPAQTELMTALPIVAGRWLQTDDTNAIVLNQALLGKEPDIRVGDTITLKMGERETTWRVVGIVREIMALPTAYALNEYLSQVTAQVGYAQNAVVVTQGRDPATVSAAARLLERELASAGLDVGTTVKLADFRKAIEDHLLILATFLVMMSALVVIVGGLGLASTMGLNVLERTREIGVLRAIGASTQDVVRIVVAEGVTIGVMSWLIAVVLSWPVSAFISYNFGMIFFEAPLEFAVSPLGMAIWLGLVIVFAAAASFYPAWGASQLTVRQVLAYE
jgi:putative ABC transport system permease protein